MVESKHNHLPIRLILPLAAKIGAMGNLWNNVKFFAIAGVGLFGDGYLNITIGLVVPMIAYLYFSDNDNEIPTVSSDVVKGGLSVSL